MGIIWHPNVAGVYFNTCIIRFSLISTWYEPCFMEPLTRYFLCFYSSVYFLQGSVTSHTTEVTDWHQKQSCLFLYCIRFKSYQIFVFIMQSWFLLNCYWLVLWMNNLGPYLFPLMSRATCYQRKLIQVLQK